MRRSFDGNFKARVALEALREDKTISEIAGAFDVHPNQVSTWKREALARMPELFVDGRKKNKNSEPEISRDDILKEVGQMKVENEFLKKKYRNLLGLNVNL